jgi:hypothetical protein
LARGGDQVHARRGAVDESPERVGDPAQAQRDLGIRSVHWSVDSPRRMRIEPEELARVDVHVCFDAHYLGEGGSQLSLGAGLEALPGCRPGERWPERSGPAISFVGSLGASRVVELRSLLERLDPEQLGFLEELWRSEGDPGAAFEERFGRAYAGAPCLYVDELRSTRRRIEVLSALDPSKLAVFGGADWGRAGGALGGCYAGRAVPYGYDLASLYYHSQVNVNVFHHQCLDSTNSRVYDVLAAGGFLLTEYRPCLEREFEIGRHLVTFASPAEAREKAEYYLAHPPRRDCAAGAGARARAPHVREAVRGDPGAGGGRRTLAQSGVPPTLPGRHPPFDISSG